VEWRGEEEGVEPREEKRMGMEPHRKVGDGVPRRERLEGRKTHLSEEAHAGKGGPGGSATRVGRGPA